MAELRPIVVTLARQYRVARPLTHPLQIILWENIGYLIDDDLRAELFIEFGTRVGFDAPAIARAPQSVLMDVAKRGGNAAGHAGATLA